MQHRPLGRTGLELSILGYGAAPLGGEYRPVDIPAALRSVRTAIDRGINLIDTSPYYGRGQSEVLLGHVLPDVPRDSYVLCTKLGRYAPRHFDFSARRVAESIDVSLERMKVDHLDIVLCHDLEFVDMAQIVEETIPAIRREIAKGKVRCVGVSGYPMKMFEYVLARADIDCLLTYAHFTLQNDMALSLVPTCAAKGVGLMNASPFSARLLSNSPLPRWHRAGPFVRETVAKAAAHCARAGSDIAKLALQFAVAHPAFATCVTGSADPDRVSQWVDWVDEPLDERLLRETLALLAPIHDWYYVEGRPENGEVPTHDFAAAAE